MKKRFYKNYGKHRDPRLWNVHRSFIGVICQHFTLVSPLFLVVTTFRLLIRHYQNGDTQIKTSHQSYSVSSEQNKVINMTSLAGQYKIISYCKVFKQVYLFNIFNYKRCKMNILILISGFRSSIVRKSCIGYFYF